MSNASSTSPESLPMVLCRQLNDCAPSFVTKDEAKGSGWVSDLLTSVTDCVRGCFKPALVSWSVNTFVSFISSTYKSCGTELKSKAKNLLGELTKPKGSSFQACLTCIFGTSSFFRCGATFFFCVVNVQLNGDCSNCRLRLTHIKYFMEKCEQLFPQFWEKHQLEIIMVNSKSKEDLDHDYGPNVTYNTYTLDKDFLNLEDSSFVFQRLDGKRFKCMLYREML